MAGNDVWNSTTSQFFGEGQAEPDYWDVYESRLYDRTEEWIYANLEMGSMSAPRQTLFHCDEVVFQYVPYPEIAEGSRSNAQMTAQDFFVGGYLTAGYDPCDMNVFNPCRTRWDQFNEAEETPYCSAYNGIVSCSVRPIETVVTAQARSVQALDSRQCSGPQSGSGAEDNGSSLQEQNQNINANASANDSTAESDNGVTEDEAGNNKDDGNDSTSNEAESNEDDTTNDSTSQGACLAYRSFWMAMLLMVLIFC